MSVCSGILVIGIIKNLMDSRGIMKEEILQEIFKEDSHPQIKEEEPGGSSNDQLL